MRRIRFATTVFAARAQNYKSDDEQRGEEDGKEHGGLERAACDGLGGQTDEGGAACATEISGESQEGKEGRSATPQGGRSCRKTERSRPEDAHRKAAKPASHQG